MSNNSEGRPKLPFLEISYDSLRNLKDSDVDFQNLLRVWTTLTKSSDSIRNGKRLENISWRVVNRKLLLNPLNREDSLDPMDFQALSRISLCRGSSQPFLAEYKRKNNKKGKSEQARPTSDLNHDSIMSSLEKKKLQNGIDQSILEIPKQPSLFAKPLPRPEPPSLFQKKEAKSSENKRHMFYLHSPSPVDENPMEKCPSQSLFSQTQQPLPDKPANSTSLFGNSKNKTTSLFGNEDRKEIVFTSDESLSDDSQWSSVSDSEESEEEEPRLDFHKKDFPVETKPAMRRSLLSGLFLHELPHRNSEPNIHGQLSGTKMYQNPTNASSKTSIATESTTIVNPKIKPPLLRTKTVPNVNHSAEREVLEVSSSQLAKSTLSCTNITAMASVSTAKDARPLLKRQSSHDVTKNDEVSSLSKLVSLSKLNLTSYFAGKNNKSGHHHKSEVSTANSNRVPATARTLLPTALSTHMFLPTMANSRPSTLAQVVEAKEDDSSVDGSVRMSLNASRRNSEQIEVGIPRPSTPAGSNVDVVRNSSIEIPGSSDSKSSNYRRDKTPDRDGLGGKGSQGATALSPRSTKKRMLASELSQSLREQILYELETAPENHAQTDNPYLAHKIRHGQEFLDDDKLLDELIDKNDPGQMREQRLKNMSSTKLEVVPKTVLSDEDDDNMSYFAKGW
ncbi:Pleiotropic negative transcriptional regulator [Komagataella phaffii CBS 7435]|uniref:Nitrogen regulatory protein areA GATA-like domain-containing protein n=2 Tax=Komagataella phaffii TaxID=460519 RepID=C4R7W7_KOMPG|nr:uncharacterized protein PAS_chr4_0962 [Komagataella phaffii GS115]AOA64608.1 GQ67_04799T0 [Komagataella phaffii]CAH2450920.1 Pleiotropic negative transcriptional regulator [Komagataella phaffii CBS 7435]AOA70355.1 GQ68_04771T0 [Komagataella phaffii GS115]CAY71692.1 hypothetical protein PAS_chr4_0962 [Komagataella phaffii GS115]CCA40705.1 Pleiotropic negative transcriptional regulator [Komagataella phaffii CBS 7435]